MKILLSPAKKITLDDKHGLAMTVPRFQEQSVPLLETLQNMDYPGLYGALSPLDGITPYRLEMGTRGPFDLYAWWKKPLQNLLPDTEEVINLASAEYAKAVRQFRKVTEVRFLRQKNGKLQETAVYAKMARGAMVRWMAEHQVQTAAELAGFDVLGYRYDPSCSSVKMLVFCDEV